MTQEQEQALRHFETRVRQLILHCGELARENARLAAEVEKRDGIIAQKDKDFAELRREFDSLKIARMIEVTGGDVKAARQRISTIIHEIDKSIALLNV